MSIDAVSAAVRALAFALLFQAAGAAIFTVLFAAFLKRSEAGVRSIQRISALLGAAVVGLHLALEAGRLSGDFAGVLDPAMQRLAFGSSAATSQILQMAGLVAIALSSLRRDQAGRLFALPAAVLALAAFLLTGHTATHAWHGLLGPLLFGHLLVVAFWFGSLLPLCLVLQVESLGVVAQLLRRFSRLAVWLVPSLAMAGCLLAVGVARGIPDFSQPYGALLLVKLAGFAALLGLAAWNRLRLVPALEAGWKSARQQLQGSILLEASVILGVLAVTAVMTSFYSP